MLQFYLPENNDALIQQSIMIIVSILLGFAIGFVNHKKHTGYLENTLSKIEFDLENCLNINTRFQTDIIRENKFASPPLAEAEQPSKIEKDDLTILSGIDSSGQNLLNQLGIFTFRQLHVHHPIHLKKNLSRWDESYQIRDIVIWQQQAGLAAAQNWEALKDLQSELQNNSKS